MQFPLHEDAIAIASGNGRDMDVVVVVLCFIGILGEPQFVGFAGEPQFAPTFFRGCVGLCSSFGDYW